MFGRESVTEEAKLIWTKINNQVRITYPFQVTKSHLTLQDADFNLEELTNVENESIFHLDFL